MISPSVWWLLVAVYDQTEHKWRSLQCIPANMVSFKLSILPDLPLPYQVWGMSSCRSWDWRKVSFCWYSMNYSKLSPVQSSSWVPSKTICRCWKSRKVLLYLFFVKNWLLYAWSKSSSSQYSSSSPSSGSKGRDWSLKSWNGINIKYHHYQALPICTILLSSNDINKYTNSCFHVLS